MQCGFLYARRAVWYYRVQSNFKKMNKQHTGVYAILHQHNQLLVVTKTRGPYTGLFDLPGGSFEHGESIDKCLKREVYEETGYKVTAYTWFDNCTAQIEYVEEGEAASMHHIGLLYQVEAWDEQEKNFAIAAHDVDGAQFVDMHALDASNASPFVNLVIKTLQ